MFESKLRFPMVSLNDSLSVYLFVRYCPCGGRKGMLYFVLLKSRYGVKEGTVRCIDQISVLGLCYGKESWLKILCQ